MIFQSHPLGGCGLKEVILDKVVSAHLLTYHTGYIISGGGVVAGDGQAV